MPFLKTLRQFNQRDWCVLQVAANTALSSQLYTYYRVSGVLPISQYTLLLTSDGLFSKLL